MESETRCAFTLVLGKYSLTFNLPIPGCSPWNRKLSVLFLGVFGSEPVFYEPLFTPGSQYLAEPKIPQWNPKSEN